MKNLISILLVLALAVTLFAGTSLAAAGDSSGTFDDFPFAYFLMSGDRIDIASSDAYPPVVSYGYYRSGYYYHSLIFILPFSLLSGSISISGYPFSPSSFYGFRFFFYDVSGNSLGSTTLSSTLPFSYSLPSGTRMIRLFAPSSSVSQANVIPSFISYSNFSYAFDSGGSSGGDYDPSLDEEILAGVEAIAQSLLDLETGPYSGVTNITPNYDENGNFTNNTLTVQSDATLNGLLNALGISSTSSSLYLKNLYDNWGNNFTYYLMDTPVTGGNLESEMVESVEYDLPTYIATFGQDLSYAVQEMRRENYAEQQTWTQRYQWLYDRVDTLETTLSTDINDALYAETDTSPSETWSVAQWLKGLYYSVTGFFNSFWSPAETAIKEANEDAMQATVTNDVHTTVQNVNDFSSMQSAVTGFLPSGDISGFNSLNDTAFYTFWSEETHQAMLPPDEDEEESESVPSNSRRLLSSSPPSSSAPVVDYGAFERNQALYQSLLGGGLSDSR